MSQWYCKISDQEIGPIPSNELKQLATSGQLMPQDHVRRADMKDWTTARHVEGLFEENVPIGDGRVSPANNTAMQAGQEAETQRPLAVSADQRDGSKPLLLAGLLASGICAAFVVFAMKKLREPPPIPDPAAAQQALKHDSPAPSTTPAETQTAGLGPRATAIAFAKAVNAGDMARARTLATGTEAEFEWFKSCADDDNAWIRVVNIVKEKQFGSPLSALTDADYFASCIETIDGSHATLVDVGKNFKQNPTLTKIHNKWKLDLSSAVGSHSTAFIQARAVICDEFAKKIAAGTYTTPQDFYADYDAKIKSLENAFKRTETLKPVTDSQSAATTVTKSQSAAKPETGAQSAEWASAYRNARYITQSEFLSNVHAARLIIYPSEEMARQVGQAKMESIATNIARQYGIQIDPQAPIAFVVCTSLSSGDITRSVGNEYGPWSDTFRVYSLLVDAGFAIATPCIRNKQFFPLTVYPLRSISLDCDWRYRTTEPGLQRADGRSDETVFADDFGDQLGRILGNFSKENGTESASLSQYWQSALWSSDQNSAMFESYQAAVRAPVESRVLKGINSFSGPQISLLSHAQDHMQTGRSQREWNSALTSAGFQISDSSPIMLKHNIYTVQCEAKPDVLHIEFRPYNKSHFDANLSSISALQYDVAFVFNGEVRRRPVAIWNSSTMEISTISKLTDTTSVLDRLVVKEIDNFASEAANQR